MMILKKLLLKKKNFVGYSSPPAPWTYPYPCCGYHTGPLIPRLKFAPHQIDSLCLGFRLFRFSGSILWTSPAAIHTSETGQSVRLLFDSLGHAVL